MVLAHAFNHSTGWQRQSDLCEFKASLICRVRTGRTRQRNLSQGGEKRLDMRLSLEDLEMRLYQVQGTQSHQPISKQGQHFRAQETVDVHLQIFW